MQENVFLLSDKSLRCDFVNSFCRTADAIAVSGYNKDTKMANRATK